MTAPAGSSSKLYLAIWGWLAGLMLLGVFLSESKLLPVSAAVIVLIVLLLSTVKALLVALYYMHLSADRRLLVLVAVAPLVLILLALSVVFASFFIHF